MGVELTTRPVRIAGHWRPTRSMLMQPIEKFHPQRLRPCERVVYEGPRTLEEMTALYKGVRDRMAAAAVVEPNLPPPAPRTPSQLLADLAIACLTERRVEARQIASRLGQQASERAAVAKNVKAAQDSVDKVFEQRKYPSINRIIGAVADAFMVTPLDIVSERRTAEVVKPRQVAAYLAAKMTPRSLPEIGRRFGGRDHTTILFSVRKIQKRLDAGDVELNNVVNALRTALSFPQHGAEVNAS